MKKLLLYLLRWQCSTPVLYLVLTLLPLSTFWNTIIANLIGGIIFYNVDKYIFKKYCVSLQKNCIEKLQNMIYPALL